MVKSLQCPTLLWGGCSDLALEAAAFCSIAGTDVRAVVTGGEIENSSTFAITFRFANAQPHGAGHLIVLWPSSICPCTCRPAWHGAVVEPFLQPHERWQPWIWQTCLPRWNDCVRWQEGDVVQRSSVPTLLPFSYGALSSPVALVRVRGRP